MQDVITDDEVRENVARNVTRLRGERSKYSLAKELDIGIIHLTRIENGDHIPNAGLLARLAEALGVTLDTLISGPKKKSKNSA